jgi:two-component system KDP operon response regulator KdpE
VDQPEHLRVLVGALRKKIEPNPSSPKYILTEPWVGYRFADVYCLSFRVTPDQQP